MTADAGRGRTGREAGAAPAAPLRFVFCGVGGQGSLFASLLLGDAAVAAGLEVVLSEIHGMSQRGGSVVSTVVIGGSHGPLVSPGDADAIVAFEPVEALRVAEFCAPRTIAVVALRPWYPPSVSSGAARYPPVPDVVAALRKLCARVVEVDAAGIAEACGLARAQNVVVLGALAGTGILPFDPRFFHEAFRLRLPAALLEGSARAFEAGRTGRLGGAPAA
jgi:indolepyruvate ferredoxin oxidoreductase beta subunit